MKIKGMKTKQGVRKFRWNNGNDKKAKGYMKNQPPSTKSPTQFVDDLEYMGQWLQNPSFEFGG